MLKNPNPGQPFPLNKERQIASYLKKIARKGKYYSGAKAAKDLGIAPSTVLQKAAKLNLDIENKFALENYRFKKYFLNR